MNANQEARVAVLKAEIRKYAALASDSFDDVVDHLANSYNRHFAENLAGEAWERIERGAQLIADGIKLIESGAAKAECDTWTDSPRDLGGFGGYLSETFGEYLRSPINGAAESAVALAILKTAVDEIECSTQDKIKPDLKVGDYGYVRDGERHNVRMEIVEIDEATGTATLKPGHISAVRIVAPLELVIPWTR